MNNNYAITFPSINKEKNTYYIVFTLKDKQYAINIQNIIEVINIPEIEIPLRAPESIIGIFNYNGMMIKTVDLCHYLGFEPSNFSTNNKLIIALVNDNCFAIHAEKIENIVQIDNEFIQPIPFELDNSILNAIYKSEDAAINIIDINILNKLLQENHTNTGKIDYNSLFPSDEKSKQILKLRTKQNLTGQEVFTFPFNLSTVNQYILFQLDNHNYYLDLQYVKEFVSIKRLNITKLPYTQNFIKGITNVKGEFIVVVDLKQFLNNTGDCVKESSKLIVVECRNFNLAFLVDEIKYIKNLKNTNITPQTLTTSKYISSEFIEENTLYSILNFDKIINDERLYININ